ncbi:MAG TPA: hypothetical protein VLM43_08170 [Desulfobacterales bacterium]|nr:hypothetical protein [Desulfobacterales bacterium]
MPLSWRKAKIPIPAAPKTGFPLRFNKFLGYFGIFATTLRVEPPIFRFEKNFNFYLNSRAASSGEFKFKGEADGVVPDAFRSETNLSADAVWRRSRYRKELRRDL